jgi:hypothetical protein
MDKKQTIKKILAAAKNRPILRFWREHILLKSEKEKKVEEIEIKTS